MTDFEGKRTLRNGNDLDQAFASGSIYDRDLERFIGGLCQEDTEWSQ